ncbi:hypothetical protein [Xanthomonas phage BUDD]|nr:hypothetical protein [Xanthomonas phage BUDD]
MQKKIDVKAVEAFMQTQSPETKVYLGADSEKVKVNGKMYADYTVVIVVHIDGCKGCKVFAETTREEDYDKDPSKPFTRMMKEAEKVAELHDRFKDVFYDFEVSIHLDINPKKTAGSSIAMEAARGYVKAMTMVDPHLKPVAFAGSYAADRAKELGMC